MTATIEKKKIRATIAYLRRCQDDRNAGYHVSYWTDPAWLVEQALNRRAGWLDDPGSTRGSCAPTRDGRYPPRASGGAYSHLRNLAREINTPRLRVYESSLGEWRRLLLARLPHRFARPEED